ncbi:MAG TPA: hypothetical protein PK833_08150 [Vicingus sp.]|nr:hypothetical protein [Vicingus sp.]
MKNSSLLIAIIISTLVTLNSCKKDREVSFDDENPNIENFDREQMLTNYADGYIVPAYNEYNNQFIAFKSSGFYRFDEYCSVTKFAFAMGKLAISLARCCFFRIWSCRIH